MKNIIFTDMDGTLLDADSYSFAAAIPALNLIAAGGIPLVLCSSKTRAELEVYRVQLANNHPFVSENGGGIYIPHDYFSFPFEAIPSHGYDLIALGTPYAEIRKHFVNLRQRTGAKVRGFGDMSIAEIAVLTGLSEQDASLAKQRDFDEAFVFDGKTDESFLRAIEASGLSWTQGRIFHIMGKHDKGRAIQILLSLYRQQYGALSSIGLGDSLNDLSMLKEVDQAVLVKHEDGSFDTRIEIPHLLKTRLHGSAGWNESMLQLLKAEAVVQDSAISARLTMLEIFYAALVRVDPYNAVLKTVTKNHLKLHIPGAIYDLNEFERIVVVGAGKATARMALALEALLDGKIGVGLIIVKDGHTEPLSVIEQVESSHPVPGQSGVEGTRRILEMARAADNKTLIICLLSGGASALMVAPVEGLTLQDKQETTRLLLNAGASISELNAVRKHLSAVKGGGLAQAAYPAQLLALILSDVIDDPLDVIASGPTAADSSTFALAWDVLLRYGLTAKLPHRVAAHLQRGVAWQARETIKENDPSLDRVRNVIIANIRQALIAAQEKSEQLGWRVKKISERMQGEARDAALLLAQAARDELALMKPHERCCLLCGGETTVTVRGKGMGGRNQELALAFALEIEGMQGVSLLSAGTDGTDGPNDAAGAIVDGKTAARARRLGVDPVSFLENNDSYHFFQSYDAVANAQSHLITGPTGTNVMDIQIVLLVKEESASAMAD